MEYLSSWNISGHFPLCFTENQSLSLLDIISSEVINLILSNSISIKCNGDTGDQLASSCFLDVTVYFPCLYLWNPKESEKDKYQKISLICGILKNDTSEFIYKTETDSQA